MWLASTPGTSLLLRRLFNNSVSSKSCRRDPLLLLLIHQTSFFTTTTFNSSSSSSKFGGSGGTFILQTNEPSVDLDSHGGKKDDIIKMFMLSSSSESGEEEEEEEDDDDDDDQKKKKKKMVFKLDEDFGFSELYKDFNLQDSIRMVGSCNGIICLHDPEMKWPLRDVYLWNPATRQFKILPESIRVSSYNNKKGGDALKDFVGFGFDVKTSDYKVMRITPFVPQSYICRYVVQVYSLSSDSWRVLDGIDSLPVALSPTQDLFGNRSQGTYYLNGSCFFLGTTPINDYGIRDFMLLSFDFSEEIFIFNGLPYMGRITNKVVFKYKSGQEFDDVFTQESIPFSVIRDDLSYLGDKLAAFREPRIDFVGGYVFTTPQIDLKGGYWYYDMWGLSEQIRSGRVVEPRKALSWTRLHKFRIKTQSKHPYMEPRCASNDGEFVLISTSTDYNGRKKLMLINLVTGTTIKDFTIDCRVAYVYKESQVSIMGTGGNALLRWQLPTHGTTYKLYYLDAPFDSYSSNFGIGLCLTSDTGGCIGVRSLNSDLEYVPSDAGEGEAKAMFEAIKWAKELELSPIIIVSDSKNMVSFFMEDNNLLTCWSSRILSLLTEAKLILKSAENSISFQYCSRSCNYVADIASKLGSDTTTWSCKDWTANFPGEVVMSLSKDLGLITAHKFPYVSE